MDYISKLSTLVAHRVQVVLNACLCELPFPLSLSLEQPLFCIGLPFCCPFLRTFTQLILTLTDYIRTLL